MNDIIRKEQLARKFLNKTVGLSGNPTFFVYYMVKTGRESVIDQLESIDLTSKFAHDLVDEYSEALSALQDKIGRFSVFCDFDDNDDYEYCGGDYRSFVSRVSANRKYFEPIDKMSDETLDEIFNSNLTVEELTKKYHLDPETFGIERVSVDSCLED